MIPVDPNGTYYPPPLPYEQVMAALHPSTLAALGSSGYRRPRQIHEKMPGGDRYAARMPNHPPTGSQTQGAGPQLLGPPVHPGGAAFLGPPVHPGGGQEPADAFGMPYRRKLPPIYQHLGMNA